MHLFGTHGTSRTRADAIIATRSFIPTGVDGHAGPGIYFWSYVSNIKLAKHLAELWWYSYTRKQTFANDADPGCAVVDVSILNPGEPSFVDSTGEDFREALTELVGELDGSDGGSFLKVTNYLFQELEKKSGHPILVAKVLLLTPKPKGVGMGSIVARDFSMSPAYVVREGGANLIQEYRLAA